MSGIVEIETQSLSGLKDEPGLNDFTQFKDDVFSGPQDHDQVTGLSEKFQSMQTREYRSLNPVQDVIVTLNSNFKPISSDILDSSPPLPSADKNRTMNGKSEITGKEKPIYDINGSRCSMLAGVASFASKAASNTVRDRLKESSMFGIFSNFKVPKIVINTVRDDHDDKKDADTLKDEMNQKYSSEKGSFSKLEKKNSSTNRSEERRRCKNYFRPYCIINRRHYTCRAYGHRNRKYGVSQKNNVVPNVEEIVQLLDKMATGDRYSGITQVCKPMETKWQYSPPPKFYTVRYRPPAVLADIKERSRSLNDLSFQTLNISSPTSLSQVPDGNMHCNRTAEPSTSGNSQNQDSFNLSHLAISKNVEDTSCPVDHVMTRLTGLKMEEN